MAAKSSLFVKWFITFAATVAASALAAYYGFFSLVFSTDISRISLGMTVVFFVMSMTMGKLSYFYSYGKVSSIVLNRTLQVANFIADILFTLGLLGTIIGFAYMMNKTLNANVDVSQIITQMKTGVATSLYTTLFGIITSLLLQLQILFFNLDSTKH